MDTGPDPSKTHLTWNNVGLAFAFILFDVAVSASFGLGVGRSLLTAAIRCVIQLAVVGLLLKKVFETNNPWAVAGIVFLLNLMGTFEAVANKSKRRHKYMFPSVLIGMLGSTIPVSILGTRFAMSVDPFWTPVQFIPIVGMLAGSTISGIVVSIGYVLKELQDNCDKVQTFLAFGASRTEASKPIVIDALRLALTPTINQMSVIGIIAIPGMMTGAILGGSSVQQAAKLQMVIMFMISACTSLATIFTTILVVAVVVDGDHRVRGERIDARPYGIWRARHRAYEEIVSWIKKGIEWFKGKLPDRTPEGEGERQSLLG